MKRSTLISIFVIGLIGVSLAAFQSSGVVRVLREGTLWAASPILRLGERAAWLVGCGGPGVRNQARPDEERVIALGFEREFLRHENAELRLALATARRNNVALKAADVIRYGRDPGGEFLIISAGEAQGLAPGEAAVDEHGAVIGVVTEAGQRFARVAVASNQGQAHDVLLLPGGARALGRGLGGRAFAVDLVPLDTPVRVGDYVALAGRGLEQTLLLGQVSAVNPGGNSAFQDVRAVLVVDPSRIRTAFVAESHTRPGEFQ